MECWNSGRQGEWNVGIMESWVVEDFYALA
jgi:hypothetical protein